MVNRLQKLSKNSNLLFFGARGTGKTSLIRQLFGNTNSLWIDLLSDEDEERFGKTPDALSAKEIEGVACHHWKTGFSELFNDTRV